MRRVVNTIEGTSWYFGRINKSIAAAATAEPKNKPITHTRRRVVLLQTPG